METLVFLMKKGNLLELNFGQIVDAKRLILKID